MDVIKSFYTVNFYDKSEKIDEKKYEFLKKENDEVKLDLNITDKCGYNEINAVFTANKALKQVGISLVFENDNWRKENYVFAPAALYNGNRFKSVKRDYAPMFKEEELPLCGDEPIITDVPRLNLDGQGRAQLNTGDLATPCVGYFSEDEKQGVLWFWNQKNEAGRNFGITVNEDCKNGKAQFILTAPCMREGYKYGMCTTSVKSDDRGIDLKKGDKLTFIVEEHKFNCESKTEFLRKFFELRIRPSAPHTLPNGLPWSEAFKIIEDKYNERNWLENPGFYKSSEATASPYRQWQLGWVGGGMNTLPGLIVGNSESIEKSRRTLDFVFNKTQHKSGFLYGIYCDDTLYGDSFENAKNPNIVMSRKNADGMYFIAKQLIFLKQNGEEVKPLWHDGLRKLADAFVRFYNEHGDLAQFIDMGEFKPWAAGTASAAIASAGLALCAEYFGDENYLALAEKIGEEYYNKYVTRGFTNAGPGEILSCPDSESAFGMLESMIALYSATNDNKWIEYAKDVAALCSSWCVSYDYDYDKESQFARRGIATSGAVWASVQNKHAAPGICTLSGASLFRLYRATGDIKYLDLCRDISHNITQFLSTKDNPMYLSYVWGNDSGIMKTLNNIRVSLIRGVHNSSKLGAKLIAPLYDITFNKYGRMGERCNLSDWEGTANVGELPGGSCWCEVSTLLIYLEVPAVYVNPDTGFCYALDHVNAEYKNGEITLENPTRYEATYRIFIENDSDREKPLDELFMLNFKTVTVPDGGKVNIKL